MSIESELAEGLKKAGQDNIALPSSMPVEDQRDKAMENIAKPIAEAIEKGIRIEFKGSLTCAEIARLQNVSVGDVYMCSDEGKVGELECRNGTAVIWTEEGWRKFFEIDIESVGISMDEVSSMIAAAISVEATARANADTALGGRIDAEANARESADATLQGNIDAEASARESADDALDARIDGEETAREQADGELQAQIDAISSRSDVVDVVASHVELVAYDTSTLADNDVIKVLADETHEDAIAYYRWGAVSEAWSFIGSQGPYYTISETDTLLAGKAPTNHASTATTYGEGDSTHYGHVKVDSALSGASTNPVQNRVVKIALDGKEPACLATFKKLNRVTQNVTLMTRLRREQEYSMFLIKFLGDSYERGVIDIDVSIYAYSENARFEKQVNLGSWAPTIYFWGYKDSEESTEEYIAISLVGNIDYPSIRAYYYGGTKQSFASTDGWTFVEGAEIPESAHLIPDNGVLRAIKLKTPRNLKVNLASESAMPFDGTTGAENIGVANTLPITHGGTGATSAPDARTKLDVYSKGEVDDALDGYVDGLANWAASDLGATKYVPMSDSVSGDTKKASLNAIRNYVRDGMATTSALNAVALVAHDEITLGLATKQDTLPLVSGTTDYDIAVDTARRSGYSWYTSNGSFFGLYLAETNFANASSTEQLTFEAFVTIDNSSDASGYTAGNLTMLVKVRGRGPDDIGCELKVLSRNGFYGDSRVQPKLVVCRKTGTTDYNFHIAIQFVDISTLQVVEITNRNYVYVHPLSKFESCTISLDKAYGAIPYMAYETQPIDFSGVAYVLADAANVGSPAAWAKAHFNVMPKYTTRFVYNQSGSEKLLIFAKGGDGYGTIVRIGYDSNAVQLLRVENGTWKSKDWEGIDAHSIDGHVISIGTYSSVPGALSFV